MVLEDKVAEAVVRTTTQGLVTEMGKLKIVVLRMNRDRPNFKEVLPLTKIKMTL